MERRAALMGGFGFNNTLQVAINNLRFKGGKLVAPVQRVTDFMSGKLGIGNNITSSYRLGVKEAACHEIFPNFVTAALRTALQDFNRQLPGFICEGRFFPF
jgi:uncharacterized FAD-dependent dehydrogenase